MSTTLAAYTYIVLVVVLTHVLLHADVVVLCIYVLVFAIIELACCVTMFSLTGVELNCGTGVRVIVIILPDTTSLTLQFISWLSCECIRVPRNDQPVI